MKEENKKNKDKNIKHNDNEEVIEEKNDNTVNLEINEIEEINKKLIEAEEKALRASAELINYRKRKDEEVSNMLKYANEGIITDILPVIDNFERALSMENADSKLQEGMQMVYKNLVSILSNYGVKEVDALDKEFDPGIHQAVTTENVNDKDDNIVLEVFQKGYMLKDKLIRPAMVKVNKKERNDK